MSAYFSKTCAGAAAVTAAAALLLSACNSPAANDRPRGTIPADTTAAHVPAPAPDNSPLQIVAEFTDPQVTGVAVAPGGKVFAFSPRWDYNPTFPVALVGANNTLVPLS